MLKFILLILVIAVIGKLINYIINNGIFVNNSSKINTNSYSVKPLMTEYEKYFYDILIELEDELDIKIHPQVNLATILNKETNNHYINELFRNIDFAIFSKDYNKLLLLIEINDSTHNTKNRIIRDKKVDAIVRSANIKLIKFYSNYPNKKEYVKERVREIIAKNN